MFFARSKDRTLFVRGNEHEQKEEKLAKHLKFKNNELTQNQSKSVQQEL